MRSFEPGAFGIYRLKFGLPLRRFTAPERLRDAARRKVLVPTIKFADDRSAAVFDLLQGRLPLRLNITFRSPERIRDGFRDVLRDLNRLDDVSEQVGQPLLANVDVAARPLEASAAVVDVLALLAFGGHRATAQPTFEQAHERVLVLSMAPPFAAFAFQHLLDTVERLTRHQGFV